jgi:hypothetical protein
VVRGRPVVAARVVTAGGGRTVVVGARVVAVGARPVVVAGVVMILVPARVVTTVVVGRTVVGESVKVVALERAGVSARDAGM